MLSHFAEIICSTDAPGYSVSLEKDYTNGIELFNTDRYTWFPNHLRPPDRPLARRATPAPETRPVRIATALLSAVPTRAAASAATGYWASAGASACGPAGAGKPAIGRADSPLRPPASGGLKPVSGQHSQPKSGQRYAQHGV